MNVFHRSRNLNPTSLVREPAASRLVAPWAKDGADRTLMWVSVATLAVGVVIFETASSGLLGDWYRWVWAHTTGRPWTEIIYPHPLLLLLPETIVIVLLVGALPEKRWARVVVVDAVFLLGLLTGHIFWHF